MARPLDDAKLGSPFGGLEQFARPTNGDDRIIFPVHDHESFGGQQRSRTERVEGLHISDEGRRIKQRFVSDYASPPASGGELFGGPAPRREVRWRGHRGHRSDALIVRAHSKCECATEAESGQDCTTLFVPKVIKDGSEVATPPGRREGARRSGDTPKRGNGNPPAGFLTEALSQGRQLCTRSAATIATEGQTVTEQEESSRSASLRFGDRNFDLPGVARDLQVAQCQ